LNKTERRRLDDLAAWMREHGAEHVVISADRLEVRLGPAPLPPAPPMLRPSDDDVKRSMEAKKLDYEAILFASSEGQ
jgi:hypothetical protein